MDLVTLYHNPRCSKSRQVLALLHERGIEAKVVRYLEEPLTVAEIEDLLCRLNLAPIDLVRRKEKAFCEAGLDADPSPRSVLEAMIAYPVLIERPILVVGSQAVIGRPPERVLELL